MASVAVPTLPRGSGRAIAAATNAKPSKYSLVSDDVHATSPPATDDDLSWAIEPGRSLARGGGSGTLRVRDPAYVHGDPIDASPATIMMMMITYASRSGSTTATATPSTGDVARATMRAHVSRLAGSAMTAAVPSSGSYVSVCTYAKWKAFQRWAVSRSSACLPFHPSISIWIAH
ncbi:hypothetical protein SEVIR_2G204150v4 [Setaria viridis]